MRYEVLMRLEVVVPEVLALSAADASENALCARLGAMTTACVLVRQVIGCRQGMK